MASECAVIEKGRPAAALTRQSRSPSAIVARQGDTVGHGPGHLRLCGQWCTPEPSTAGQLLAVMVRLSTVSFLNPTA